MSVKTYCKYAGVTMLSILEHTASPVRFHILHDGTLSQENREKLNAIVAAYPAASLEYNVVDMSQLAAKEETYRRLSIGPLFRLRMFDALPRDLKRVIQLDADLVVNLDLAELWNLDLQGNMLAACVDTSTSRKVICEKGLVAYDEYINVGVVLWDVAALQRENIDLYRESNAFFRRVPDVRLPDEEAVNVIFHGRKNLSFCGRRATYQRPFHGGSPVRGVPEEDAVVDAGICRAREERRCGAEGKAGMAARADPTGIPELAQARLLGHWWFDPSLHHGSLRSAP